MLCDPFLIKKLLKNKVCESHKQYTNPLMCTVHTGEESITMAKKKRRKHDVQNARCTKCRCAIQPYVYVPIWIQRFPLNLKLRFSTFSSFFFPFFFPLFHAFCFRLGDNQHCSSTVHVFKNIKNGSHDTIHTFKNYFVTVFSVFSFSNNKHSLKKKKKNGEKLI